MRHWRSGSLPQMSPIPSGPGVVHTTLGAHITPCVSQQGVCMCVHMQRNKKGSEVASPHPSLWKIPLARSLVKRLQNMDTRR